MRAAFVCIISLASIGVALLVVDRRAEPLPFAADAIVVHKQAHKMDLMRAGALMREYRVALGRGGLAPKVHAGDNLTPEGSYTIVEHNPHSSFHLALRVGYPTPAQVARARSRGFDPGGDIMIHGIKNGLGWVGTLQRQVDWTAGCIAVSDSEIEQIFAAVPDGTRVTILP